MHRLLEQDQKDTRTHEDMPETNRELGLNPTCTPWSTGGPLHCTPSLRVSVLPMFL